MKSLHPLLLASALLVAACHHHTPTEPTPTTTTSIADPTISETFDTMVPVGGFKFYSFSVIENGTVNVTLTSVGGDFVPPTLTLSLGLGTPTGMDCSATTTANVSVSTATPHLTATYAPGVYCIRVADVGNLFAPAHVIVSVNHS